MCWFVEEGMKRFSSTETGNDSQVRWSHAGAHEEDEVFVPRFAEVGNLEIVKRNKI